MTLDMMKIGDTAKVTFIDKKANLYQRFLDIGVIENTKIECVLESPAGDPKAYMIRGAVIAIRSEDAKAITVESINNSPSLDKVKEEENLKC